jgi:FAD/FMN-containing dehydrogenase
MVSSRIGAREMEASANQVADYLKKAGQSGKKLVPFSSERLTHWRQGADRSVVLLNLEQHRQILEHSIEDQVILVETGIQLSELDHYLKTTNQWLPISFGSTPLGLLEAIITGNGGALAHYSAGPRRLVLGLTLALSNGTLIRTGGRVVKNVTGYDLTKLIVGSYGIFAVPVTAYLRLYARPERFLCLTLSDDDPARLLNYAKALKRLALPIVALELVDARLIKRTSSSLSKDTRAFVLLIRLAGSAALLEVAREAALAVCEMERAKVEELDDSEAEARLWAGLFDLTAASDYHPVEVAASAHAFRQMSAGKNWFGHPFLYDPGLALIKIFPPDEAEQNQLIAGLSDYTRNGGESLTISYGDRQYIRRVRRTGVDVSEEEKLFSGLKSRFDAANCLNPFVSFEAN